MKYSNSITLALAIACGFTLSSRATDTVIVNDTWADGNRTSSGPDGGGIDTPWFGSAAADLTVPAPGDLRAAVPATSLSETTYFASQTLANTGDELMFTWVFAPSTLTQNTSQAFNLAIVNGATHLSADGTPASQVYAGYSMFMNMAPTLANGNPYALREWATAGAANNLLSSSAAWGANGTASATLANGGTTGNTGFVSGLSYTLVMTLTRNAANGLDITSTMTGGSLNNTGSETLSFTDTTPNTFTYDTFALRQTGAASGAAQVDSSLFKVDFITTSAVPEPTTFALAGLGLLGLAGYRRMRQ